MAQHGLRASGTLAAVLAIPVTLTIFACSPRDTETTISAHTSAALEMGEATHFTLHASADAIEQADLGLWLTVSGDETDDPIRVVPDSDVLDERIDPDAPGWVSVELRDLSELCPVAGEDCDIGFTVIADAATTLSIRGTLRRTIELGDFAASATVRLEAD